MFHNEQAGNDAFDHGAAVAIRIGEVYLGWGPDVMQVRLIQTPKDVLRRGQWREGSDGFRDPHGEEPSCRQRLKQGLVIERQIAGQRVDGRGGARSDPRDRVLLRAVLDKNCPSNHTYVNQLINFFFPCVFGETLVPKKNTPAVTKSIPAVIARTQFGQIMELASHNREQFLVTQKGEAKAVIMGVEDFLQATVKTPQSLATLQKQTKKSGTDKLTLEEIEREIAAVHKAPPHSKA
jgi:hypothetical protein